MGLLRWKSDPKRLREHQNAYARAKTQMIYLSLTALATMVGVMCLCMIVVVVLTPQDDYRDDLDDEDGKE